MLDAILMHRRETGVPRERDEIWERETKNLLSIFSRELC
jgi:hypothetical protein